MKRSQVIFWIILVFLAVLIVWRIGIYIPEPGLVGTVVSAGSANEPNETGQAQQPIADSNETEPNASDTISEPNESSEPEKPTGPNRPAFRRRRRPPEPNRPSEPNDMLEAVNLKDVEMKEIIQKLAEWTGKVIIPTDEAMKQKVTIYSSKKLPRNEALSMIYSALRTKGYIAEHTDSVIFLKPIGEAKLGMVPTIPADQPLATLENKDQIAQKFFKLVNYSPAQMAEVVQPLIGEYGHVSADEITGSLLVIDTVANLMRIERIIVELDVSKAEQTETEIFEIRHGDPEEIVQLLQTLLGDVSASGTTRGGRSFRDRQRARPTPTGGSGTSGTGGATSVTVGTGQTPRVLIAEPKNNWIIVKASAEDIEQIREWIAKLDKPVPTITTDYPLARIENKNQVVQYFFKLKNYSPTQMAQVVEPLLTDKGYVSADESTGQLLAIDTVESLINIERIITQFDVPEAEQTVTEIFEIRYGDPSEIVQLLRMLISGESSTSTRSLGRSGSSSRSGRYSTLSSRGGGRGGASTSVVVGTGQTPVLIPEPKRKWIIARASAEDMKQIGEWIDKLDKKDPVKKEYETVAIGYADVQEVAQRLNEALQQMPGTELQASVLIQPLVRARQIVIFGREDMREMVKKLIAEVDVPAGEFETKVFKLEHADPDQIKENLDGLYEQQSGRFYSFGYSSYSARTVDSQDTVKVISFPTMNQVTVIASPENMRKIEEQIKEWDVPLDVTEVKPRIIELHNSDPVQMADLLTSLFTEETERLSFWDLYFGEGEDKQKIVGPLYGQLTFEDVPGTKKIIIISKIPAAYDVVEELIRELDRAEMAEVPRVITLNYADPEKLAERLNALFNEPGTVATIRFGERGLSDYSMEETEDDNRSSSDSGEQSSSEYRPWWTTGRRAVDEEPISNVIGRVRFIPDPHSKSILVLAPPEFMDHIEDMIKKLDIPGKQVMIKAVIVEVDHSSLTSLGLQLTSDQTKWLTLDNENAVTAITQLQLLEQQGSLTLSIGTNVTTLIDFLAKTINAKILNQQTLWTKDNEEASFFKGDNVAFQTDMSISEVGGRATSSFEFQRVGMTLRARPSITPEKNVDMVINVILSQLTSDKINSQPVRTEMETTTNMIVQDGQTIMLGGILFQKDSMIRRKLPVLGDVPVAGGLFRHREAIQANNEMLIFITPYVIDEPGSMLTDTIKQIETSKDKLRNVREQLQKALERLQEPTK